MTTAAPLIDTRKCERRTLQFQSLDEILAEANQLAAADRDHKLRTTGNWQLGKTLGHLAAFIDYGYSGFPMKVPAIIKWVARPFRNYFLTHPMSPGRKIPNTPTGTLATEDLPVDIALPRFVELVTRLKSQPPSQPHAIFGKMSQDQWVLINLRHAELHLSFFTIE